MKATRRRQQCSPPCVCGSGLRRTSPLGRSGTAARPLASWVATWMTSTGEEIFVMNVGWRSARRSTRSSNGARLLSDLSGKPKMEVAKEVQDLIKEARTSTSTLLTFHHFNDMEHWQDTAMPTRRTQTGQGQVYWRPVGVDGRQERQGGQDLHPVAGDVAHMEVATSCHLVQRRRNPVHPGGRGERLSRSPHVTRLLRLQRFQEHLGGGYHPRSAGYRQQGRLRCGGAERRVIAWPLEHQSGSAGVPTAPTNEEGGRQAALVGH